MNCDIFISKCQHREAVKKTSLCWSQRLVGAGEQSVRKFVVIVSVSKTKIRQVVGFFSNYLQGKTIFPTNYLIGRKLIMETKLEL